MSMCERMSELMPAVAAGRSEWAGEEAAHLESCTDCAAEWALVRTASLGLTVATGRFGADMKVDLVNDGPVTLILERTAAG